MASSIRPDRPPRSSLHPVTPPLNLSNGGSHQDAAPADTKQDEALCLSSPASNGELVPLDPPRYQVSGDAENGAVPGTVGPNIRRLSKVFGNAQVSKIPLARSSDEGAGSVPVRKGTPRRERGNTGSGDRILSPRIEELSRIIQPVVLRAHSPRLENNDPDSFCATMQRVPDPVVEAELSHLLSDITRFTFKCKKKAEALSACIQRHPHNRGVIIETLIQLREKHIERFDKVLILTLAQGGNESFMVQYFQNSKAELGIFAPKAAAWFAKHRSLFPLLGKVLSSIMSYELRFQKREDLFRVDGLSSFLFRELAGIFCSEQLEPLKENIADALKREDPSSLCLVYNEVKEALRSKNPSFGALSESEQEPLIQKELASNADQFIEFARPLLTKIYAMQLPVEFCELLAMRRGHIISFLKKQPLKADEDPVRLSRVNISEVICLRILSYQIVSINFQLKALSKVVQCLAKEEPFGTEKSDLVYKRLNPLFDEFFPHHCQFIDRCSLPKSEEPAKS